MKKLFGLIILGLILNTNAIAETRFINKISYEPIKEKRILFKKGDVLVGKNYVNYLSYYVSINLLKLAGYCKKRGNKYFLTTDNNLHHLDKKGYRTYYCVKSETEFFSNISKYRDATPPRYFDWNDTSIITYTNLNNLKFASLGEYLFFAKEKEEEKRIAEQKKREAEKAKLEAKKPKPKKPIKKEVSKNPGVDPTLITIGSGSGFYINNKGYALTNNHVVDICAQSVAVVDGKETLFRVIATDKTNDVAVLKTDYKSRNYIKINEDGAKLGENVIAVGYPLAGRLSDSVKITRGIVSSLSGLDNNIGQIQIDAALQPGNSGGPVLNENGELVGIASAGLNKLLMAKEAKYIPENVNFAVASPIVVNILKSKKVKYATPSMFSGSFSNTELAELGDSSTIQLFCRNTRTAYNRLKSSNKYSTVLLDLD